VARWAWLLYRDQVLAPGTIRQMADHVALVARFQPSIPYGLGVQAVRTGAFRTLGHSGRFLGFRGVVRYLPAYGVSIAVLTNQSRTDVNPIVRSLLRRIFPSAGQCAGCPGME
jgi:CubicO group peptidase (beta-lactamase class C family)